MLGPRVNIQLLMEGIGIQARKDYLEATEALEKGRDSIHYLMCDAVKSEVENWFYIMFDYEQAEAQVEELRKLAAGGEAVRRQLNRDSRLEH